MEINEFKFYFHSKSLSSSNPPSWAVTFGAVPIVNSYSNKFYVTCFWTG